MGNSKEIVDKDMVFDPRALRLTIGLIAFLLPWVVILVTLTVTSSISASYHTRFRDIFVGVLFVIGVLFAAYNGHQVKLADENIRGFWRWLSRFWPGAIEFRKKERLVEERLVSLLGGTAAVVAALCPTNCDKCPATPISYTHGMAAAILFSGVVYFCLIGFLDQVRPALRQTWKEGGRAKWRAHIYQVCGWVILAMMLASALAPSLLTATIARSWKVTFWAETAALLLFGVAWMTASKFFWFLVDSEAEQYKPVDVKLPAPKTKRQRAQSSA